MYVELTDEETMDALVQLKQVNSTIANNLMKSVQPTMTDSEKILLDKMLISSYTYLSIILDRKIEGIRQEMKREYYKRQDSAKANLAPKTSEKTITGGKSMIEEVFDSKEM
jgi:hypothetical protein